MAERRCNAHLPLVVVDFHQEKSLHNVCHLLDNLVATTQAQTYTLAVWNSTGINIEPRLSRDTDCQIVHTVESTKQFLNSNNHAIKVIQRWSSDCVIIVDDVSSVGPEGVKVMLEKFLEYDSADIVCSQGLRLFPHQPFVSSKDFWTNGRYTRHYNNNHTDREVHLFLLNGGCCLFPTSILIGSLAAMEEFYDENAWETTADFHLSMVGQKTLKSHIWKIQMSLSDAEGTDFSTDTLIELDGFYKKMKTIDWPPGTFAPILPEGPIIRRCKNTLWTEGFHGLNMSAEPVHLDFEAARGYGASVVRFGAANDAKDLAFLVNDIADGTSETDKLHLQSVLSRLQRSVKSAGDSGLKVILSLCDLPGRRFRDCSDDRMWQSIDCRQRIADLWGAIATGLCDLSDVIIGYDIINEPFTSDDNDRSFDCQMSNSFMCELNDLYVRTIDSIRAVDKETMIIVESSFWASPKTVPYLIPLDDPFIVYSFHFYAPNLYTYRHANHGQYTYPGRVPQWKEHKWVEDWPFWDQHKVREVIQPVIKWQTENGIPASRVFVGEFGVSREVPGAQRYLSDVMEIWKENGWNWCLFSFRDNEWDAMDYELGDHITNQLDRKPTEMMKMISRHLS